MNKKLYIDLIKVIQYGGKKNKHKLASIKFSEWFTTSDSTSREDGNSIVNINKSVFGLNIYGKLGGIRGTTKNLVGFCIAETRSLDIPRITSVTGFYFGFYFKAIFDERIKYQMRVKTSDLYSQESYVAPIKYSKSNKIFIPFTDFRPTYRGNYFIGKPLDIRKLSSVGIQLIRSNQTNSIIYNMIPLKFNFTLLSDIYFK